MKENFLQRKRVILVFAIIALISGLLFLSPIFTGNITSEEGISIDILSIVGFLLMSCFVILITYYLRKR